MARLFQIVPVTTAQIIRRDDGSVEHKRDPRVTYAIGEDAEQALDLILEPYGQFGGWYFDKIEQCPFGPPWAFVALRREYDIATYVSTQRDQIDARGEPRFNFTPYDGRTVPPKVGCLLFFSKNSVAAVAEKIRFLRPAWTLLQDKPVKQNWIVLLDEDPADVMSEAASYAR
jgi:hypothetical protein